MLVVLICFVSCGKSFIVDIIVLFVSEIGYHISRVEALVSAKEIEVPACRAFGPYARFMHPDAVKHPAKFNVYLIEYLVDHYTKEGDVLLDPMAGTGVLGVIAALRGRNVIQVEIEPLFFEWMEYARKRVEEAQTLGRKGWIVNILGDSRELRRLLSEVAESISCVITSPPYAETISRSGGPPSQMIRSGQFKIGQSCLAMRQYSPNPNNIGNLKLGDVAIIDHIITSPPYLRSFFVPTKMPQYEGGDLTRYHYMPQSSSNISIIGYRNGLGNEQALSSVSTALSDEDIENIRRKLMKNGKPTYLSEMLKVYREMWHVLKPGGNAIIVVKAYVRNWKPIDLPYITCRLCEIAGFRLVEVLKYRLRTMSFYRVLQKKRFQEKGLEFPKLLEYEYVLIFKKE